MSLSRIRHWTWLSPWHRLRQYWPFIWWYDIRGRWGFCILGVQYDSVGWWYPYRQECNHKPQCKETIIYLMGPPGRA